MGLNLTKWFPKSNEQPQEKAIVSSSLRSQTRSSPVVSPVQDTYKKQNVVSTALNIVGYAVSRPFVVLSLFGGCTPSDPSQADDDTTSNSNNNSNQKIYYPDIDRDSFGDKLAQSINSASPMQGYVVNSEDCDDENGGINPDANDPVGDGIDQNCDGVDGYATSGDDDTSPTDDDVTSDDDTTGDDDVTGDDDTVSDDDSAVEDDDTVGDDDSTDDDDSAIGDDDDSATGDDDTVGDDDTWVADDDTIGDDDDSSPPADDDTVIGDDDSTPAYVDDDGDGHYSLETGGDDFDDTDATSYPGAPELCDGVDNDGDTLIDNNPVEGTIYYRDQDHDGFGTELVEVQACETPGLNYVTTSGDADDTDPTVYPGAPELCDTFDNDQDGLIDEGLPTSTTYADLDGDGFGNPATAVTSCAVPEGYVADSSDCDDARDYVHPGASENVSGLDKNCDGDNTLTAENNAAGFEGVYDGVMSGKDIEVLDMNGDGYKDIAISSMDEGAVYVYLGSASGYPIPSTRTFNAWVSEDWGDPSPNTADVTFYSYDYGFGGGLTKRKTTDDPLDPTEDLIIADPVGSLIFKGRSTVQLQSSYDLSDSLISDSVKRSTDQVTILSGVGGYNITEAGNQFVATDGGSRVQLIDLPANDYGIHNLDDLTRSTIHDSNVLYAAIGSNTPASGDVDGDGQNDLLIGNAVLPDANAALLYFDQESLPANVEVQNWNPDEAPYLAFRGMSAGSTKALSDLDGDGKAEVILGIDDVDWKGKAFVIPGSTLANKLASGELNYGDQITLDDSIADSVDEGGYGGRIIEGDYDNDDLPETLQSCDITGDGNNDLIVGVPSYAHDPQSHGIVAFYNGASFLNGEATAISSVSEADQLLTRNVANGLGNPLACGDVNGDGYADLVATDYTAPDWTLRGVTYLFAGGASLPTVP